jgi:transposase
VNTINEKAAVLGRRRRKHSDEFKAQVVAACSQPGISIAAVSMAHGVNANLARRWISEAGGPAREVIEMQRADECETKAQQAALPPSFIPVTMPPTAAAPAPAEIRVELRRGLTAITVTWPGAAAAECATWMRELLR